MSPDGNVIPVIPVEYENDYDIISVTNFGIIKLPENFEALIVFIVKTLFINNVVVSYVTSGNYKVRLFVMAVIIVGTILEIVIYVPTPFVTLSAYIKLHDARAVLTASSTVGIKYASHVIFVIESVLNVI